MCRQLISMLIVLRFWLLLLHVPRFDGPVFYSDSKYVVQVARAILQQLRQGVNPQLPQTNLDCWLFFLNAVRGADLQYLDIVKVKAHQDWRQLQGVERCLVWYNGIVDTVAKSTARQFSQVLPGYSQLVQSFFQLQQNAEVIMWYHADIAWCATHDSKPEVNVSASVPLSASSFRVLETTFCSSGRMRRFSPSEVHGDTE